MKDALVWQFFNSRLCIALNRRLEFCYDTHIGGKVHRVSLGPLTVIYWA